MKQRYTITIADLEVNVISDGSPEAVESLVGIVDRKMREILVSNRRCTKSEAAILCALDYCSDKLDASRKLKQCEGALDAKEAELRAVQKENDKLRLEIETLRESLLAAQTQSHEVRFANTKASEEIPAEEAPQIPVTPLEEAAPAEEAPIDASYEKSAEDIAAPEPFPFSSAPESIAPEDVIFDPTEMFRRPRPTRGARKGPKRK